VGGCRDALFDVVGRHGGGLVVGDVVLYLGYGYDDGGERMRGEKGTENKHFISTSPDWPQLKDILG